MAQDVGDLSSLRRIGRRVFLKHLVDAEELAFVSSPETLLGVFALSLLEFVARVRSRLVSLKDKLLYRE